MDDLELPASPRKKLKLQEPFSNAECVGNVTEVQLPPKDVPQDYPNATTRDFSMPNVMSSADTPSSSPMSATASTVPTESSTDPGPTMHVSMMEIVHKYTDDPSNSVNVEVAGGADALRAIENKEIACGITEYVSRDLLSFSGIVKKRYTDFIVNEILPSGEVVHLDNLKAPSKPHRNAEISNNPGDVTSTNSTEQRAGNIQITTQRKVEEQGQPRTAPRTTANDESHAIPHPDTHTQEYPIFERKDNPSAAEASQAIPQSMQGFDTYELAHASVDHQEKISPHKRMPPPAPSIPLSMQDLDDKQPEPKQEKAIRRKEKVYIRQTSQGWVEFDKDKEDELKKRKAEEDAAAGEQAEDATQMEETKLADTEDVPERKDLDTDHVPEASTQASWQAFASSAPSSGFQLQPEDKNTLLSYFNSSIVDEILALYDRIVDSPHRKTRDYGLVKSGVIDRQKRTTIHQDIRRIFDSRLETMTDGDGAMIITAMAVKPTFYARTPVEANTGNNKRGNRRGNDRGNDRVNGRGSHGRSQMQASGGFKGKPTWEDLGGKYLHFSLYKENKDTMEAVSWLAKQVRMQPRSFQFAGTKDRRAVTVQRISVERVHVNALISAGRTLRNAYIGNFEYRPHPLQLGELNGNEFVITLRDCDFHYPAPLESKYVLEGAQMIVRDAVENLSERGFINYYGLQRFGTFAIGTEVVGVKMLQGDFQGAVDAILDYNPASLNEQDATSGNHDKISMDDRARAHALHSYRTTNRSDRALMELPRRYSAESSIIRHLTGRPDHREDYIGALQMIPRNLRLMYVHAYQSLVWNVAASERWKRFGTSVTEGDLVLVNDHSDKVEGVIQSDDVDADGEAIVLPGIHDRAANPNDMFERARALTKEEAESGSYNIFDIVLPTPGYDIIYPSNEIGKFYEAFMASERGGGLNPHDMRRQWKDISLSGSYRKLLARPGRDISFEIKAYKDEDEQFVVTDADRLGLGSRPPKNLYPRGDRNNHAHQDDASRSLDESERGFGHTRGDSDSGLKQNNDNDNVLNDNDDAGNPINRTKTPSQESEDTEEGGVALIGGAYRDHRIAVVLKMQLGSSQYATIALRELLKGGGLKTYKADFSGGR